MKKENIMTIICSSLTIILYFSWILITQLIFNDSVNTTKIALSFIMSSLVLLFLIFSYRHKLKEDWLKFIKEKPIYITFISFLSIVLIYMFLDTDMYMTNLFDLIHLMPFVALFQILIFSPIVEEIVFRASFKNAIEIKWLFVLTSGLIYGILHVAFINNGLSLLTVLPFTLAGLVLSYVYAKYDNLILNIVVNFLCSAGYLLVLLI